jgi:peroxiredoxin
VTAGTCWKPTATNIVCVLQAGETAPDFTLPATGGEEVSLDSALEKFQAVVLLFYVLDFTGG